METRQIETEYRHDIKLLEEKLDKDILSTPEIVQSMIKALNLFRTYLKGKEPLNENIEICMYKIMRIVMVEPDGVTLSQLVGQMRWSDDPKYSAEIGELIVCMAQADLFDTVTQSNGYVDIEPVWLFDDELIEEYHIKKHMPPMIVPPKILTHNKSSAYLTVEEDSLILQKGNHHDGEICLDSLNKFNQVPLELDNDSLTQYNPEHHYLLDAGNKFYLPHKYDKRGRTYCVGYHTSYQSDEYHKSVINLANKELII